MPDVATSTTYSLFAELNAIADGYDRARLLHHSARYCDGDTTKLFFQLLGRYRRLSAFYAKREQIACHAVDHRVHFSLIGMARGRPTPTADIVFNIRQVSQLADPTLS